MKSAILLVATGLTGNYVLNKLLKRDDYSKIIVFSRRALEVTHEKLEVIVCDLLDLEDQKDKFKAASVMRSSLGYDIINSTMAEVDALRKQRAKTKDAEVKNSIDKQIKEKNNLLAETILEENKMFA